MVDYILSFQPVWFFCVIIIFTALCRRSMPHLCFLLWVFALVRFLFPFGLLDLDVSFHPMESIGAFVSSQATQSEKPLIVSNHQGEASEGGLTKIGTQPQKAIPPPVQKETGKFSFVEKILAATSQNSIKDYFVITWLILSAVLFLWYFISYQHFRHLLKYRRELNEGPIYDLFLQCCKEFHIESPPKIYTVSGKKIPSPFTYGLTKKSRAIIIPNTFLREDEITKKIIFVHELIHIKRRSELLGLVRFACLIMFHLHPLRIITDRYVDQYKEICCDLDVIKILGIDSFDYAKTLATIYLMGNEKLKRKIFVDAFIFKHSNFVRRMQYLRDYNPDKHYNSPKTKYFGYALVTLLFMLNLSIWASLKHDSVTHISGENTIFEFPTPQTYDIPFAHSENSVVRRHNGQLWIVERHQGLFGYQLQEDLQPLILNSYTSEIDGMEEGQVRAYDLAFYGNYAYLAVGSSEDFSFEHGRVEILQLSGDGEINKIGEIEHNHPRIVRVIEDSLWVSGSGDFFGEGAVEIYDLQSPESPEFMDSEYFPLMPLDVQYSSEDGQVIVLMGEEVVFFSDPYTLNVEYSLHLEAVPYSLSFMEDGTIILNGVKKKDEDGQLGGDIERYLISLSEDDDGIYEINHITQITIENAERPIFIEDLIVFNEIVLVSIHSYGLASLQLTPNGFTLLSLNEQYYINGLQYDNKIIMLNPEYAVFDAEDFQKIQTPVWHWWQHAL